MIFLKNYFIVRYFRGDEPPVRRVLESFEDGSIYNLTALSMCAHNGTHIDAPYHFYKDGKTIDQLSLESVIGKCYVTFAEGPVSAELAQTIVDKAKDMDLEFGLTIWKKAYIG